MIEKLLLPILRQLTESADIREVDNILSQIRATPAIAFLVHRGLELSLSSEQQQRNHAASFYGHAIQEIENKGLLKNFNSYQGNQGSYGSTRNVAPYGQPARMSQDGGYGIDGMARTYDQWNGAQQTVMMNKVTHEMISNFHQKYVVPVRDQIMRNSEIVKNRSKKIVHLRNQIRELKNSSVSRNFEDDFNRNRRRISETMDASKPQWNKKKPYSELQIAKSEVTQMNDAMNRLDYTKKF